MGAISKGHRAKIKFAISAIRHEEVICHVNYAESDRICLNYPAMAKEIGKYLIEGKEVEVLVYTDNGIYIFDSIVINSPFESEFVVELPEESTKIQRRKYVRAPIVTNFVLIGTDVRIDTSTINIGGGGVRFKTDRELAANSMWKFQLTLPQWTDSIKGSGKVLYTIRQEGEMISIISFTDVSESDRSKIIKVCFEEEAHRLKRNSDFGVSLGR